jgi:hypothetical protein
MTDGRIFRRIAWGMAVSVTAVAVVLWPIQGIVVFILLAIVAVMVDLYGRWKQRHALGTSQRRSLDRAVSGLSLVVLIVGVAAALLWPGSMVFIAVGAAVAVCVLWSITSCAVWLVAMQHDLHGTHRDVARPVERRTRRPRPAALNAQLPEPHVFRAGARRPGSRVPVRRSTRTPIERQAV